MKKSEWVLMDSAKQSWQFVKFVAKISCHIGRGNLRPYEFVTIWRVNAPIESVWSEISVQTTKGWMNLLAPIARPVFSWNHNVVMNWGAKGLASRLGTGVVSESHISH